MKTKHIREHETSWAKVRKEDLTREEVRLIKLKELGYCENHHVLYKMEHLHECFVSIVFCQCSDPKHRRTHYKEVGPCKEW